MLPENIANALASIDSSRMFLGSLCKRGHDYKGTGMSLRRKNRGRGCIECASITKSEWRKKNPDRNREHSLRSQQKPEFKERRRLYREVNRERIRQQSREYTEKNKEAIKARVKAYKDKNRDAIRQKERERYYRDIERERMKSKAYRLSEAGKISSKNRKLRYRSRKQSNYTVKYSILQLQEHLCKFNNQCAYCCKNIDTDNSATYHADHFIPVSMGGANVLGNIVPTCPSCNFSKNDKDPYEWYFSQTFASKKRWRELMQILGKKDNYLQLTLI